MRYTVLAVALLLGGGAEATRPASLGRIKAALRRAEITPPDPALATVRQLCTLRLGTRSLPAIDIVETIKLAQSDRLHSHVVILDGRLRKLSDLTYYPPARALPCQGATLLFSDVVKVDNTLPEGRRVRVGDGGRSLTVVAKR